MRARHPETALGVYQFLIWTVDGLKAWARHGYDPRTNNARPMWADGTDLTDHVIQRTGYYGRKGTVIRAGRASTMLFWSYALGTVWRAMRCSGRPPAPLPAATDWATSGPHRART